MGIVKKVDGLLFLEDQTREEPPQHGGVGRVPEVHEQGYGSQEERLEK